MHQNFFQVRPTCCWDVTMSFRDIAKKDPSFSFHLHSSPRNLSDLEAHKDFKLTIPAFFSGDLEASPFVTKCHPVTGECRCSDGWTGPDCRTPCPPNRLVAFSVLKLNFKSCPLSASIGFFFCQPACYWLLVQVGSIQHATYMHRYTFKSRFWRCA